MIPREVLAQGSLVFQHIGRTIARGDPERQAHQSLIGLKVAHKQGCRQTIGNLVEGLHGHVRSFR
jgi:hypothetical protein